MSGEFVAVARTLKVRGLKGELVAEILTDFPERFARVTELTAIAPDGKRFPLRLERYWFQGPRIVLKFTGFDTTETARQLVGHELAVPEEECVELLEDEFYDWELADCQVETISGELLGRVREVLRNGPNEVLVVINETTKREYLLPFVAAICVEVDIDNKLLRVDPPDGLLDW